MDCGPATIKSVLQGHGIRVNFDRLRERCQTDVDGTSIAALETIANDLGLSAETILVPKDSLTLRESSCLPAIVFTETPGGLHFIVVWSVLGSKVQIMDPSAGRAWVDRDRLLERVAPLTTRMTADHWRTWAGTPDGQEPLLYKMRALGMSAALARAEIARADQDTSWKTYALLDAGARMVRTLIDARAVKKGTIAANLFSSLVQETLAFLARPDHSGPPPIPTNFWSVVPAGAEHLQVSGAILLYVSGRSERKQRASVLMTRESLRSLSKIMAARAPLGRPSVAMPLGVPALQVAGDDDEPTIVRNPAAFDPSQMTELGQLSQIGRMSVMGRMSQMGNLVQLGRASTRFDARLDSPGNRPSMWGGAVLPTDLPAQLQSEEVKPLRVLFETMRLDSKATIIFATLLVVLGVATTSLDALLMRGLSDIMTHLTLAPQRAAFVFVVVVFFFVALAFESVRLLLTQRLGRGLEARLRVAFMEKLPRLEDRYLRSRAASDMISRAHLLQTLRQVPGFFAGTLSTVLGMVATLGLLLWVHPASLLTALVILFVAAVVPVIAYKPLNEYAAKLATQDGGLFRFYLDALVGIVPVRVHGAERVVRREHEGLLTEWTRSTIAYQKRLVGVNGVTSALGIGMTALLVYNFFRTGGDPRALLLIVYFAQKLPSYASSLVGVVSQYTAIRQNAMRLFEPLAAAETNVPDVLPSVRPTTRGVTLSLDRVEVVAAGRTLLSDVNLRIGSGDHIAIVGASGAGKSTLLSVLLGWLSVTNGRILVDGQPFDATRLAMLRQQTAWVDPGIQLWNTHLIGNILYGSQERIDHLGDAAELSDVLELLERLPDGFKTQLGEGGAKVSGGQGQRVRLARAMMRHDARLVLLDEPFRGLERDRRRVLLQRARELWRDATILFVSHDVSDTTDFGRVLVIDQGRIAEDGTPEALLTRDGIYRKLVEADRAVRNDVWNPERWRRVRVEGGTLTETPS